MIEIAIFLFALVWPLVVGFVVLYRLAPRIGIAETTLGQLAEEAAERLQRRALVRRGAGAISNLRALRERIDARLEGESSQ